jgi:SET domain-containing protein
MIHQSLYIELTEKKGKGVFTAAAIPENIVVELSPVIVMKKEERIHLDKTLLHDYIFEWGAEKDKCCMALGFIPIYNHSYKSNCEYFMDFEEETIFVKTVRAIEKGEELTINYNGDWNDETKVWFEVETDS